MSGKIIYTPQSAHRCVSEKPSAEEVRIALHIKAEALRAMAKDERAQKRRDIAKVAACVTLVLGIIWAVAAVVGHFLAPYMM